jgi:hypothetical protein
MPNRGHPSANRPTSTQVGTPKVVLRVTDARGASDTQEFKVSTPGVQAYVDGLYTHAVLAVERATESDPHCLAHVFQIFPYLVAGTFLFGGPASRFSFFAGVESATLPRLRFGLP